MCQRTSLSSASGRNGIPRPLGLAVLIGLAFLTPAVVFAGNVPLAGVVPGTVISKQVQSARERKFEDVVEQKTDFSCGAAALATILQEAYHRDLSENQVVQAMLKISDPAVVREQGFSLLDVKHYLETLGMRGRGYRVPPEVLKEVKVPAIVLLNYKGYKHFVVLRRATDEQVYLGDPALGNRVMPLDEFAKGWNGVIFAVIGNDYDQGNALPHPREALTVWTSMNRFTPVPEPSLRDFGFIRADFF